MAKKAVDSGKVTVENVKRGVVGGSGSGVTGTAVAVTANV